MREALPSNFAHLKQHDEQLVRLGMLPERYFAEDPNTSLLKLRPLAEFLAQLVASKMGLYTSRDEAQDDLTRCLQDDGIPPRENAALFEQGPPDLQRGKRRAPRRPSRSLKQTDRKVNATPTYDPRKGRDVWVHAPGLPADPRRAENVNTCPSTFGQQDEDQDHGRR